MLDSSFLFPSSPTNVTLIHSKLIIDNELPTRLIVLALLCLSCSVLPGRSGSQHFQCSTTPTLDCSDFPHSLLLFFCLLICLLVSVCVCVCVSARLQQIGPPWPLALVSFRSAPSDQIPSDQRPRIEPPRFGTPSLLSLLGSSPSARSLGLAHSDRPPWLEPLRPSASPVPNWTRLLCRQVTLVAPHSPGCSARSCSSAAVLDRSALASLR